jgi:uncharacterized heparinase superfamily protein
MLIPQDPGEPGDEAAVVVSGDIAKRRMGHLADRLATLAARVERPAGGFISQPEPRSIGTVARGKQLVSGNLQFAGTLVEAPGIAIWDAESDNPGFLAEAQGFAWIDDLAALGTQTAHRLAQDWTWGWIDRYGTGRGPGWSPDLTGRRVIRWIHHATILLAGRDKAQSDAFYLALSRQAAYLSRRWKAAAPGLPRFEALTGLAYAGLSLMGLGHLVPPATRALAAACSTEIDGEGALVTRNPEELTEVLTLLTWAAQSMTEAGHPVPPELSAAITRIAPALRALRHADGSLARFHGGGEGAEGRLDQALAAAGARHSLTPNIAMGFVRLSGRRTTVIVDASAPPGGRAAINAHASTTAFELSSGRRALVVSCGPGRGFGPDWHQAARATQSHSALCLDGSSSSRFGQAGAELAQRATITTSRMTVGSEGADLYLAHDGWLASHGLTASRSLTLSHDGRRLSGVDALTAITADARRQFNAVMTKNAPAGLGFSIRFHLHPDVDANLDMSDTAVSLALRSGEIWIFRATGPVTMQIDPSAYLEQGRLKPRPTRQIVLRGQVRGPETRIGWTLAKAKDTPLAIRDMDGAEADTDA